MNSTQNISKLNGFLEKGDLSLLIIVLSCTAAFTDYYDPAILQNKLTPLSIIRDLGLRKRDSKKNNYLLL